MAKKQNKLFIIDWGKKCSDGRYAMIEAASIEDAFMDADSIGSPAAMAEFKIKTTEGDDGGKIKYIELTPDNPYSGPKLSTLKWKTSSELFRSIHC